MPNKVKENLFILMNWIGLLFYGAMYFFLITYMGLFMLKVIGQYHG